MKKYLSFPGMGARWDDLQGKRTAGTCMWIFDQPEFVSWMAPSSSSILWLRGNPGSGKSTLMAALVESSEQSASQADDKIVLKMFFHGRGSSIEHSVGGLLRSLLYQLLDADNALVIDTRKALRLDANADSSRDPPTDNLLKLALKMALMRASKERRISVFVDALDEAGQQQAIEVVKYLQLLLTEFRARSRQPGDSKGALLICFSCRRYPIISLDSTLTINLEQQNFQDIRKHIIAQFQADSIPQRLSEQLLQKLLVKADGSFLWVVLTLNSILDLILAGNSDTAVSEAVDTFPDDLNEIFRDVLSKANPKDRRQRVNLFQWMCHASLPDSAKALEMTPNLLRFVLVWNCDEAARTPYDMLKSPLFVDDDGALERRITHLSCGLIELRGERAQFIHQTARDFMLAIGLELIQEGAVKSAQAIRHDVFRFLVKFLAHGLPKTSSTDLSPRPLETSEEVCERAALSWREYYTYSWASASKAEKVSDTNAQDGQCKDILDLLEWPDTAKAEQFVASQVASQGLWASNLECFDSGTNLIHLCILECYDRELEHMIALRGDIYRSKDARGNSVWYYAFLRPPHRDLAIPGLPLKQQDLHSVNTKGNSAFAQALIDTVYCEFGATSLFLGYYADMVRIRTWELQSQLGAESLRCMLQSSAVIAALLHTLCDVCERARYPRDSLLDGFYAKETVLILLNKGADPNASYLGMSPLDILRRRRLPRRLSNILKKRLVRHGAKRSSKADPVDPGRRL